MTGDMRLIEEDRPEMRIYPELKKIDAPIGPELRPQTGSGVHGEAGTYDERGPIEEPREFRDHSGSRFPESGGGLSH